MARLEAALDRIGTLASQVQPGAAATLVAAAQEPAAAATRDPASPEVLDRLDRMIFRLRAAIDEA